MLTDPDDMVLDPFAGSCITGEVADKLRRKWLCIELVGDYLKGAIGRFQGPDTPLPKQGRKPSPPQFYKIHHPETTWKDAADTPLPPNGGRKRVPRTTKSRQKRTADK
jgi:site-specific DNA-methyltransferase (cytosine-N4-specific)